MTLNNKSVGFALTGSYCTFSKILPVIDEIVKCGCKVTPILSNNVNESDNRFGNAKDTIDRITISSGIVPLYTINDVEPLGPKNILDILIIAPCTGNTLAKLANGITDTPVLMAAKGHLRNNKPLVIFLSSNDSLGMNLKNIGILLNSKNIFFVPFGQDNPEKKPNSMVSEFSLIIPSLEKALEYTQLQPVIL